MGARLRTMMPTQTEEKPSKLMQYLPSIFQESPFLGQFLLAFEKILLGQMDDDVDFCYNKDGELASYIKDDPKLVCYQGLEKTIAKLAIFFDPGQTPAEFLPWLTRWTAFTLRADLTEQQQRDFVARIISLYRWRGTSQNLEELLRIFTMGSPKISEAAADLQIGDRSTVGKDTYIEGGRPHIFKVTVVQRRALPTVQLRQLAITRALIELEKPAHTAYELEVIYPGMQIGVHSEVGINTLLGRAFLGVQVGDHSTVGVDTLLEEIFF